MPGCKEQRQKEWELKVDAFPGWPPFHKETQSYWSTQDVSRQTTTKTSVSDPATRGGNREAIYLQVPSNLCLPLVRVCPLRSSPWHGASLQCRSGGRSQRPNQMQWACMELAHSATPAAANIQGPGERPGGHTQNKADTVVLPGIGLRAGMWEVCWQRGNGVAKAFRDILTDTRKIYCTLYFID